eukprot:scaffold272059_cov23-Attheya_sp.AAC.1
MLAALNDLSVLVADVGNIYLNAHCHEKLWYTAGKEFGSRAGTKIVLERHGELTYLEICGNLVLNQAKPSQSGCMDAIRNQIKWF